MKYTGLIQKTTELKPAYNETFWEVQLHWMEDLAIPIEMKYHREQFSLNQTWNFNSLTDTKYQTMFAQVGSPMYCWVPEREIMNTDSELFQEHKAFLIRNQIKFVDFIDGYYWVVNDDTILEAIESAELSTSVDMGTQG